MKKSLMFILAILLITLLVVGTNYEYKYNPYSGKRDRTMTLNQTGYDFIADYLYGNLGCDNITGNASDLCTLTDSDSNLTGQDIVDAVGNWSADKSSYYNITEIELMNTTLDTKIETYNNTIVGKFSNDTYLDAQDIVINDTIAGKFATTGYTDSQDLAYNNSIGSKFATTDTDTQLTGADVVSHVGNWSADKSTYSLSTEIELMNTTLDDKIDTKLDITDQRYNDSGVDIESELVKNPPVACPGKSSITQFGPDNFSTATCTDYITPLESANSTTNDRVSVLYADMINLETNFTDENTSIWNEINGLSSADTWWTINEYGLINTTNILGLNWTSINNTIQEFNDTTVGKFVDTDTNLTEADIVAYVGDWLADKSDYYTSIIIETMNTSIRSDLADTDTNLTETDVMTYVNGSNVNVANLGTLDGYEASVLLDNTDSNCTGGACSDIIYTNTNFGGDVSGIYNAILVSQEFNNSLTDTNCTDDNSCPLITYESDNIDCSRLDGNTSDICTLEDTDTQLSGADIIAEVGNWSADESNYYTSAQTDTAIQTANDTIAGKFATTGYTDSQDLVYNNSIGSKFATTDTDTQLTGADVVSHVGNWSADESSYSLSTEIELMNTTLDDKIDTKLDITDQRYNDSISDTNCTDDNSCPLITYESDNIDCSRLDGNTSDICTLEDTDTQDLSYSTVTNIISLVDGGSVDLSQLDTDTSTWWTINFFDFINNTNILELNWTSINATIQLYNDTIAGKFTDTDTQLTGADVVSHVGNWSADESNYYTSTQIESMNTSIRSDVSDTNESDNVEILFSQDDDLNFTTLNGLNLRLTDATLLNYGTFNDAQLCAYSSATGYINCDVDVVTSAQLDNLCSTNDRILRKFGSPVGSWNCFDDSVYYDDTHATSDDYSDFANKTGANFTGNVTVPGGFVINISNSSGGYSSIMFGSKFATKGDPMMFMSDNVGGYVRIIQNQLTTNDLYIGGVDANGGRTLLRANAKSGLIIGTKGEVTVLDNITANAFIGQPRGWITINDDGTAGQGELAMGEGSAEAFSTHQISWDSTANYFTIEDTGNYRVRADMFVECVATGTVNIRLRIDGVEIVNAIPTCHSSVDPQFYSIVWDGEMTAGQIVNVTIDSTIASDVNLAFGSSFSVDRNG